MYTLGALAVRFGCELKGDPDRQVDSVGTLATASERSLAFLANPRYRRQLARTRAAAVILEPRFADDCPVDALVCSNPYATFARIAQLLHPPPAAPAGIHPSAQVHPQAQLAAGVSVGPNAVIERGVTIGERAVIGPNCILMEGVQIGADTRLIAAVTVCRRVSIGARALVHPGAIIGSDGFGFAPEPQGWVKVPQLGGVHIGDDVEIGANSTIDCGTIEDTVIEEGVKLDNLIQVGHNVRIGAHTAIAGCTGISGSTVIGRRCIIGGMVGIAGHLTIGDEVHITGFSLVSRSLRGPGVYSGSWPAQEARQWRQTVARLRRLGAQAIQGQVHDQDEDDDG